VGVGVCWCALAATRSAHYRAKTWRAAAYCWLFAESTGCTSLGRYASGVFIIVRRYLVLSALLSTTCNPFNQLMPPALIYVHAMELRPGALGKIATCLRSSASVVSAVQLFATANAMSEMRSYSVPTFACDLCQNYAECWWIITLVTSKSSRSWIIQTAICNLICSLHSTVSFDKKTTL
jgi:hypothetical protein